MINYTEIKLKNEWMGYPKKMVLTIQSEVARQLIERGTAVETVKKEKSMASPKVDKMVKSPARKKRK